MAGHTRQCPEALTSQKKDDLERDVQEVRKLVEAGALGKATNRLRDAQEIAGDTLTLQATPQLFPVCVPVALDTYDEQEGEREEFELHFAKALRAAPPRSAAGPDGWRYEHFQLVQAETATLRALAAVASAFARNTLPPEVQRLAAAARLLPLAKSDTRIRPINLSAPLRRLASSAVNKMAAAEVAEGLQGTQFGYKHTAGAEVLHKLVSTALHVRPDYAVLSLDAADAFQNLSRHYINEGIDAHCPKLRLWARGFLPDAGEVVYHDHRQARHTWHQTTGIFQGCGMATTLFCLGLDRALQRAKHRLEAAGIQHELFAYVDDLTILARPCDLPRIYATYTRALADAGLQTRAEKCEVWARNPADLTATDFPVPRVARPTVLRLHTEDYSGLAPTPLTADPHAEAGTLFATHSPRLQHQKEKRVKAVNKLMALHKAGLSVQTSLVLLRTLTAGDMTWHMRTTGVPAQDAAELDAALTEALETLLETQDLAPELREKYWHPIALGGLGFQKVTTARKDAQHASWALCERQVLQRLNLNDREHLLQHCPHLRPTLEGLQRTLNDLTQEDADQQAPETEGADTTQRRVTRHRRHHEWTEWLRRTRTEQHQRAWAQSTTLKGAGAWLGPPSLTNHHLADKFVRAAVRLRLGAPVRARSGPCSFRTAEGAPCGCTADILGRHTLCCPYGGFMVKRHNHLRDAIARALREAGVWDVEKEPVIRPSNGPNDPGLRADLQCTDADGVRTTLDITIVHPASQQSLNAGAAHAPGTAVRLAEQAKRRKYATAQNFHPLGFEVSGGMGESTRKWLSQQVPEGPGRQETLSNLHRTLSVTIAREVARTLLQAAAMT